MHLYLVKSDIVKARYFFTDEVKATALYNELKQDNDDITLKYLKTSDEWTVEEIVSHFNNMKECL